MNPAAILALIGDLYGQVADLTQQNQQLREALGAQQGGAPQGPAEAPASPK